MLKIAIMGAMEEEINPLLQNFTINKTNNFANNIYYECLYKDLQIVIAYSKIGKVFSTLTASIMIEKFKCNLLLFTGVAGAINSSLKIGDLIVATKTCQHDLDITAFGHPNGFVPGGNVFIETNQKLVNMALKIADENNISISQGIIATGDQFIANKSKKEFISNIFNADVIEMEGSSVATVCNDLNIPCLILRAISDTADMDAEFNFEEFLNSSAKKSANFLIKIIDRIIIDDIF